MFFNFINNLISVPFNSERNLLFTDWAKFFIFKFIYYWNITILTKHWFVKFDYFMSDLSFLKILEMQTYHKNDLKPA